MNAAFSERLVTQALRALFAREFRAALINRYFQVFLRAGFDRRNRCRNF
jgi:hypothetical protein